MEDSTPEKPAFRFLSFANVEEDAEKTAKLKAAAAKLEDAIAREKAVSELVDYKEELPDEGQQELDLANDTRSLYERLREQRDKKKNDLDESKKLSNLMSKLDEGDVEYLNEVARNKREEELRKRLEIQDALEAKRVLDEQKIADQERKIKDSFMGLPGPVQKSSMSKLMMASRIKVKPKLKDQASATSSGTANTTPTQNAAPAARTASQSESVCSSDAPAGTRDGGQGKSATPSNMTEHDAQPPDEDGGPRGKQAAREPAAGGCTCRTDVTSALGTLASLPIVRDFRDSSDDSDAWSNDDLEERLVPRSYKRLRK